MNKPTLTAEALKELGQERLREARQKTDLRAQALLPKVEERLKENADQLALFGSAAIFVGVSCATADIVGAFNRLYTGTGLQFETWNVDHVRVRLIRYRSQPRPDRSDQGVIVLVKHPERSE